MKNVTCGNLIGKTMLLMALCTLNHVSSFASEKLKYNREEHQAIEWMTAREYNSYSANLADTKQEKTTPVPNQEQRFNLKGKVLDDTGESLPGANIIVLGGTRGVSTDIDGAFEISISIGEKLKISYLGMEDQIVSVNSKKELIIIMKPKADELDEVTVVAFAKQKKESVIGSITTVKPLDLKIPSSNLTTALAGRLSGMIAYQRSGEPGKDNAQFFIRGVTTFGYKKDPLILIDSNESTTAELARLQPDDIAAFSIMKDATATALYGSRGANGVILITTKQGAEGPAKVNVRLEASMSQPTKMVELADPITYMRLHNEAVLTRNPMGIVPYSQQKIVNTIARTNPYVYPVTDWYGELFHKNAMNYRGNFNVSGGGKVAHYYIAGSYITDKGVLKVDKRSNFNNNINLNRYMLRANVGINITKTTEAVIRLSGAFDDYTGPIDGGDVLFSKVVNTNPVLFPPSYAPDKANIFTKHLLFGNAGQGTYTNPYADMLRGYRDSSTSQMAAQFELTQKLDFITEGLTFRAMFNTNRYSSYDVTRQYVPFYYTVGTYDKVADTYVLRCFNEQQGRETLNYSPGGKSINATTYFESALSWNQTYKDKHELGAMLVFTLREATTADAATLQASLPSRNLNLAGRATYAYDSRYFLEANFGYNGSERFAKKERFGFFPSIGVGWMTSNEAFWNDNLKKVINKLKLKVTHGLSGNDAIGRSEDRFFYISEVNLDDVVKGAYFGTYGNEGLNGVSVSRYPNDDITWETARKTNFGIELGLFDKLELQVDYFRESRWNILMSRASIPTTMGLQASVMANVGKAKSDGVDISLNYNHYINKDAWITGMANFTYATSQFTYYEEPNFSKTPWKSRVGTSLNQTYGYIAERLFVDDEEVRNSPTQFGDYRAGDIKYKDINGDGRITELDEVPIGHPTSPEVVYGFGLSGGYKQWDFSFFFQGLARESFWISPSATAPFINGQNALLKVYADDHWSEENRNVYSIWPRLSDRGIDNNYKTSTWFMRNGSFLRLKSVELGYTIPSKITKKAYIKTFRFYLSGTNLLTFSPFKLWDPEMGGNGLGYPVQRVFNLGALISF